MGNEPTKKSDVVRSHVAAGEWKKALGIAKGFRLGISKAEAGKMALAYECMAHEGFYTQLGMDIGAAISEGIEVLKSRYAAKEA